MNSDCVLILFEEVKDQKLESYHLIFIHSIKKWWAEHCRVFYEKNVKIFQKKQWTIFFIKLKGIEYVDYEVDIWMVSNQLFCFLYQLFINGDNINITNKNNVALYVICKDECVIKFVLWLIFRKNIFVSLK